MDCLANHLSASYAVTTDSWSETVHASLDYTRWRVRIVAVWSFCEAATSFVTTTGSQTIHWSHLSGGDAAKGLQAATAAIKILGNI